MKKVLIVQRRLTHYRIPFFEILKKMMSLNNLELIVAFGEPTAEESKKNDSGILNWGIKLKTKYMFNGKICWQPFNHLINDADVIIITHENKLIYNLIPQWFLKNKRVILWGHGENLQKESPDWRDSFKRITAKKADWWLGYTDMSVPLIQKSGFPANRITVLNNTIDTQDFQHNINSVDDTLCSEIRGKYNIYSNNVGIFIGSLYEEKRLDFLIKSCFIIRQKITDFELIIAGNGKLRDFIEQQSRIYPWIHYVGNVKGVEKATLLSLSKVMLNPGLVGLGILDSFLSGTPMLTTDCGLHSPEVVYLESFKNGIMTADSLTDYSQAVIDVILDQELLDYLQKECLLSGQKYTLNNMAENFTSGILCAINHSLYRFF